MVDFSALSQKVDDSTHKEILAIIGGRQAGSGMTTDSVKPLPMTPSDIEAIQQLIYTRVRQNEMEAGPVQSLDDAKQHIASGIAKLTVDSYFNPITGTGTTFDPTFYNTSTIPVSMMPQEASAYYSNGGIAGMIIDTKAGGMLTNGYRFIGNDWKPEWLETLKEYADAHNFDQKGMRDPNRDGLIYGGAMAVPSFKKDNAATYGMSIEQLLKNRIIEKDCISNIWHADRWNCVLVPDWNIAASDYLTPKRIFVPIAGVDVNTERAAILRPKQLPYWGTIQQMGWGISEFPSWIQPLLGYQIGVYGVPQLMQQMSLMFSQLPLDAILAAGGPNAAKALAEEIGKKLAAASNVFPKMLNSAAEIKVIERNFTGYPDMIKVLEDAICANAELSPSIVFGRDGPSFGNDDGESTLKMAGSIQKIANKIIPQLQPLVKILVYSCFGPDSEQAKIADKVRVDFDSPVVLTNKERNEAATSFSAVVTAMVGAGLQPGDALEVGKSFIPDIELPQDILDKLAQVADMGLQDEPGEGINNIFSKPHPEADGVGNLGAQLRGDDGVGNLAERLGIAGPVSEPVKTLGQRIKGMFSRKSNNV